MNRLPTEYRIGQVLTARVEQVLPFGAFVRLRDGAPAYIRRRELTRSGNVDPREVLSVGQELQAAVVALPEPGRNLELSVRCIEPDPWEIFSRQCQIRDTVRGTVKGLTAAGVFVELTPGVDGLIPLEELAPWPVKEPDELLWTGDEVEAMITHLDREKKQLRLSIRRQMAHQLRTQQIVSYLRSGQETLAEPPPAMEEAGAERDRWPDLERLGLVLVVDGHPIVREQLVIWLKQHGCRAESVASADEGWARLQQGMYHLALVDLDGQDKLEAIRALRERGVQIPILGMGIPEWIAEQGRELESLGVVDLFFKPLNLDEVLDSLARLARGELVGPVRAPLPDRKQKIRRSFQQFTQTMRSSIPLEERLEAGLAELTRLTRAELSVLFHRDPSSHQVRITALTGQLSVNHAAEYALATSPVKDLIVEGGHLFRSRLSDRDKRRFQKLLDVVEFQSCIGVPIAVGGRVEHALFLFHREANALSGLDLRHAYAMAALLGAALESKSLEERLLAASPLLLSGNLAAGFGHDVYNKMSALELQVRNLHGMERASAYDQLGETLDQLLQNMLDLKQTVEAFRDVIRAEEWVTFDVNSLLQRAAALLRTMASRYRGSIKLELAPDLPPVLGSPVRLEQVFLNLMLNALQQMSLKLERWPAGVAELHISTGLEAEAVRPLWVRFRDTGPGIHRQWWDDIFALGFSTRPGGTGLGLYIVRCLVESMGGAVCVETSPIPLGTTFRVELPIAQLA